MCHICNEVISMRKPAISCVGNVWLRPNLLAIDRPNSEPVSPITVQRHACATALDAVLSPLQHVLMWRRAQIQPIGFSSNSQLLTHWREKLAFQEKRNAEAAAQLAALDAELAKQREVAAQLKRERAECRQQNERIKCQTDVINSELLSADWEATQERIREAEAEVRRISNGSRAGISLRLDKRGREQSSFALCQLKRLPGP